MLSVTFGICDAILCFRKPAWILGMGSWGIIIDIVMTNFMEHWLANRLLRLLVVLGGPITNVKIMVNIIKDDGERTNKQRRKIMSTLAVVRWNDAQIVRAKVMHIHDVHPGDVHTGPWWASYAQWCRGFLVCSFLPGFSVWFLFLVILVH